MKKTDTFTKIIAGVMFVAAALYLFGWLWRSAHADLVTADVELVSITDSAQADGIAVRDETLLSSDKPYISVAADDGKSVAKGAVIAAVMSSEAALERRNQADELKLEIQNLETVLSGDKASAADVAERDADIRAAVLALTGSVSRGDITGISPAAMNLASYVFQQDSAQASREKLESLNKQLSGLQSQSGSDSSNITAPASGIFSRSADGCEGLSSKSVQNLTVSRLGALFNTKQAVASNVFGKLVTSDKWYFAAKVDAAHAALLTAGKSANLQFPRYYSGDIPARVVSVSPAEGGVCAVVFSSERALADTLPMRRAAAQIVFSETKGLRVPLRAVHVDNDGTYVFCLTAQRVEKKYVDIISTEDDCYLVSVGSDSNALREGNTLIVSGKGVYEGRVVES